jgi:hypothetical protein
MVFNDVEAFRTLEARQLTVRPGIAMATNSAAMKSPLRIQKSLRVISASIL